MSSICLSKSGYLGRVKRIKSRVFPRSACLSSPYLLPTYLYILKQPHCFHQIVRTTQISYPSSPASYSPAHQKSFGSFSNKLFTLFEQLPKVNTWLSRPSSVQKRSPHWKHIGLSFSSLTSQFHLLLGGSFFAVQLTGDFRSCGLRCQRWKDPLFGKAAEKVIVRNFETRAESLQRKWYSSL